MRGLPFVVVSALARVEVAAALWRKHRVGQLGSEGVAVLATDFEADWDAGEHGPFAAVALTADVLSRAALAVARHPLRASDGIQLASALAAREADETIESFVCFDERLAAAARAEGFAVTGASS